jgi:hypothetical protein
MTRLAATLTPNPADPAKPGPGTPVDRRRRLLTAFALTPLLAGFYPAIFLAEPSLMPVGLVVSYLSAALFGIPLVLYFDRSGLGKWWMYILGGAACSVPTVILYSMATPPEHMLPFGPIPVLGLLLWGASSGIVFWMIGVAGSSSFDLRSVFDPIDRNG